MISGFWSCLAEILLPLVLEITHCKALVFSHGAIWGDHNYHPSLPCCWADKWFSPDPGWGIFSLLSILDRNLHKALLMTMLARELQSKHLEDLRFPTSGPGQMIPVGDEGYVALQMFLNGNSHYPSTVGSTGQMALEGPHILIIWHTQIMALFSNNDIFSRSKTLHQQAEDLCWFPFRGANLDFFFGWAGIA